MTSAAVLVLAATLAAGPAERATLGNGLVLWRQESGAGQARIAAVIRRADAEDGEDGAVLVPWMRLGGTRSLSPQEVARGLAEMGAELTCSAASDRIVLELRVDAARFRPAIRLFADILMYPAFDESRLKDAMATPCGTAPWPAAVAAAWPAAAARAGHGRPSRDRVLAYHRRVVVPENMVLVVDGKLSALDVTREARAALETWSPEGAAASASLPGTKRAPRTVVVHGTGPGRSRVYYTLGGAAPGEVDYAAEAVLGFLVLREAGAALVRAGGEVRGLSLMPGAGQLITAEVPEVLAARAEAVLSAALVAAGQGRLAAGVVDQARRDAVRVLAPDPSSPGAAMVYGELDLSAGGAQAVVARLARVGERELRRAAGRMLE